MHDYHLTNLASDHRQQLLAEARQHRLAASLNGSRRPRRAAPAIAPALGRVRAAMDTLLGRTPPCTDPQPRAR